MDANQTKIESDRELLRAAHERGALPTLGAFMKLSGPGWMQSAITLGGGSLASSLFLGVLAGYSLMWLQPLAMILGIVMLSAIGYVTLSTGQRPFVAINDHVNPVLGWGWALAVAAANVVWCLPQYSLANGVISRNLLPGVFGEEGLILRAAAASFGTEHWMATNASMLGVAVLLLVVSTVITWSYDRGGWGIRLYETMLKVLVAVIVLCFFGVVVVMSLSSEGLPWNEIGQGLIPDFRQFFRPAATFDGLLSAISDTDARQYWTQQIVSKQRDVMISAAATAVGINMTFLFPYSLLRRGWTREFRGLAIFDLCTGMLIPYVLATGCVVIASAAQFHTRVTEDFQIDEENQQVVAPARFAAAYQDLVDQRTGARQIQGSIDLAEQKLAATLVDRKANDLAESLTPLTGSFVANIVFGIGVLAMTLSTISLLMLISGFVFSEVLGFPPGGTAHRIGTLLAGVGGTLGPFVWSGKASFYLAVPTSVFGFVLLPFAYVTFVFLMNQKRLLGADAPTGAGRVLWNLLMGIAASIASVGAVYMIWDKVNYIGIAAVCGFILIALLVQVNRYNATKYGGSRN
jgi:Mn2+/Fe2+ NRAMP family transporter